MGQLGFRHSLSFRLAMWAAKLPSKSCNAMDLRLWGREFHDLASWYAGKWRPAITDGAGSNISFSEFLFILTSRLFSTGFRMDAIGWGSRFILWLCTSFTCSLIIICSGLRIFCWWRVGDRWLARGRLKSSLTAFVWCAKIGCNSFGCEAPHIAQA